MSPELRRQIERLERQITDCRCTDGRRCAEFRRRLAELYRQAREVDARIMGFLANRAGAWFCDLCLHRDLGIDDDIVREAIEHIAPKLGFKVGIEPCSSCGEMHPVIQRVP
jgi:hypothetical protein